MSAVTATHHGDVAITASEPAPRVREVPRVTTAAAFSLRKRVVTGALCGLGLHLLATLGWTSFFAQGWPAMILFLPQAVGFAIAGGWAATLYSLAEWTERAQ
jgi:hypothetical protein